jgi:hypothetical protein
MNHNDLPTSWSSFCGTLSLISQLIYKLTQKPVNVLRKGFNFLKCYSFLLMQYFWKLARIASVAAIFWWRFLSSLFINRSFNTFRSIQSEQFKEKLSEIRDWGQADRHFAPHYRLFLN